MIDFIDNAFPDIERLREVVASHKNLQPDDQPYYTERSQQAIEWEPLRYFFEQMAQKYYDRVIQTYNIVDGNVKMHVDEMTHAVYDVGQYIKPHLDGYNWKDGYRMWTLILYLDDCEEGGQTVFPQHNKAIYPKKNRLVIFPTGINMIHHTEPVVKGQKQIVQAWAYYYLSEDI